jgi:hypothetical protein
MLKLKAHSGFQDLFLNHIASFPTVFICVKWDLYIIIPHAPVLADISILSRARGEGYNLLISTYPCQTSKHILASMNFFDSDMSKSTNMVVYFDWIYFLNEHWHLDVLYFPIWSHKLNIFYSGNKSFIFSRYSSSSTHPYFCAIFLVVMIIICYMMYISDFTISVSVLQTLQSCHQESSTCTSQINDWSLESYLK